MSRSSAAEESGAGSALGGGGGENCGGENCGGDEEETAVAVVNELAPAASDAAEAADGRVTSDARGKAAGADWGAMVCSQARSATATAASRCAAESVGKGTVTGAVGANEELSGADATAVGYFAWTYLATSARSRWVLVGLAETC